MIRDILNSKPVRYIFDIQKTSKVRRYQADQMRVVFKSFCGLSSDYRGKPVYKPTRWDFLDIIKRRFRR